MNAIHFVNVVHEFVPHARRRDDKTEAVLDHAMKLIAHEGLEALTLARVAQSLGLVTTALYRYFPSKDALLAALQRRAVTTIHAHFRETRARLATPRSAPEVAALVPLLGVARAYVALPQTHADAFRLVSLLLGDPRRLVPDDEAVRTAPLVAGFLSEVAELFAHAQEQRALDRDDALTRTVVLWATLHGLTQLEKLRRLAPHARDATALCDEATGALLRGFGADPAHLSRARRALDRLASRGTPEG